MQVAPRPVDPSVLNGMAATERKTMKIRSLLAFLGLAISFALPVSGRQTPALNPQLGQQPVPLSVIGRWSQTFKGKDFGPTQFGENASSMAVREAGVWKKRLLTGLRSAWSLPSKFFSSVFKVPPTSLFSRK